LVRYTTLFLDEGDASVAGRFCGCGDEPIMLKEPDLIFDLLLYVT
jgi:hypothetical protein